MKKIIRYRTPQDIGESRVRGEYYAGIASLLEEEGFKSVQGFNGIPFWTQPIICYDEKNAVVFNPYIPIGISAPPTSLDVIIISEDKTLADEIKSKFPGLKEIPAEIRA